MLLENKSINCFALNVLHPKICALSFTACVEGIPKHMTISVGNTDGHVPNVEVVVLKQCVPSSA